MDRLVAATCAARTGDNPADATRCSPASLRAAQAHPAPCWAGKRQDRSDRPAASPVSPEGDQFPQTLRDDVSRLSATRSAVPASLPRLTAYPRRDGRIVGMVFGDGDKGGCDFSSPLEGEEAISTS